MSWYTDILLNDDILNDDISAHDIKPFEIAFPNVKSLVFRINIWT